MSELQQVLRTANVDVLIRERIVYRRPNTGLRSEMDDRVVVAAESIAQRVQIPKIAIDQAPVRMCLMPRNVVLLDGTWIEGVEVVENRNVSTVSEQRVDEVTADEPGPAGDKDVAHQKGGLGPRPQASPLDFARGALSVSRRAGLGKVCGLRDKTRPQASYALTTCGGRPCKGAGIMRNR